MPLKLWPNYFLKGLIKSSVWLVFPSLVLAAEYLILLKQVEFALILLHLWNFPGEIALFPRFWECCSLINCSYIYLSICIFFLLFFALTQVVLTQAQFELSRFPSVSQCFFWNCMQEHTFHLGIWQPLPLLSCIHELLEMSCSSPAWLLGV